MSNLHSEASYMDNLFDEISIFLSLKGVHSRKTEVRPVTSEKSSDNTLNNVPASTFSYGKEPVQGDSQLESDMLYDSTYNNNLFVDISSFNTAKKTENIDESQYKNTSLEDFKWHESNSKEEISLPNENQSNSDMIERTNTEPTERIKSTDENCETHIQGFYLPQNFSILNGNERSSPKNTYSEGTYENENYKRKQLVQKTPQDEDRHCIWDEKTEIERRNFGEKFSDAAQQIEQQVEINEKITCCTTDVDTKKSDEIQCCQIVEANTLIDQQHFSTSLSSEIHDNFLNPSDTKNTNTYPDITLTASKVKNKEMESKSHLCQGTESLHIFSSLDKKSNSDETFCSESRFSSSSSDDGKFKTAVIIPVKSVCANGNTTVNLNSKPMVYSGEIAKVPCVAINKTLSNFRLKLSNQPKQVYIPSRFLHQYNNILTSKSERNIPSESNVPILTPISPVMQIYPNIFSLNTASTNSSPQRQTIPTSSEVKKEKINGIKTVVLKSILPSTMKTVAKYVSVSGVSPVASSGIYSTAGISDQKGQLLGNYLPKSTPLIMSSTKTAVGNTEMTHSVTTTESSSELAPTETPVTERSKSSLLILPSVPKVFSDALNISESAAVSTVKISAQELENKGSMSSVANQKVFNEDLNCHRPSTNIIDASSSTGALSTICKNIHPEISSAEMNKLNMLPDSDAVWAEDAMGHKDKEQMANTHSNSNEMNIGKLQIIRKFKLGSSTTFKRKNKCEGSQGMTKTSDLVHSTRKNRKILPKCVTEIKCKENPNEHDIKSSITELEQKNKKRTKVSRSNKRSIQRNKRNTKDNDAVFLESSTNKLDVLNKTIIPPLGNNHKVIDKHTECKSKPNKFIENNICQQDLAGKAHYSESTSQEYICDPSWKAVGSDKRLSHEVNNVDSNSHPSVFKLPSIVSNYYQTKDTQRCTPCSDTTFCEPGCFSTEHDHSGKFSYSAAYDINAGKESNNFAVNNQTSPLNGTFSTSINDEKYKTQDLFSCIVHQMVPTSQIVNPCLPNENINMFFKDTKFDNYCTKFNTGNCKFTQKTYSNVNENNSSKEWEYVHQQLNELSQSNGDKVNISLGNKHNTHYKTNNDYENEIGPNIQNINSAINEEKRNLSCSGGNFNNMLTEPRLSMERVDILNYKKHVMEYLHGKTSGRSDGNVQQLQNKAMQNYLQNNESKKIPLVCKQEKTNMQHLGKYCKRKRKTTGPSKTAIKLERDRPYVCCYCGKAEQYKAILQRHMKLEHGYMPLLSTKI